MRTKNSRMTRGELRRKPEKILREQIKKSLLADNEAFLLE